MHPCRIGSTRGVEVIDRIIEGVERSVTLSCWRTYVKPCSRVTLWPGRMTPFPVQRYSSTSAKIFMLGRGIDAGGTFPSEISMFAIDYKDHGTPASDSQAAITLEIDGRSSRARGHLGHARRDVRGRPGSQALRNRHSEGLRLLPLCLVEIEAEKGYPASCTTTVAEG